MRGLRAEETAALREATRTGRPRGSRAFVRELEERLKPRQAKAPTSPP